MPTPADSPLHTPRIRPRWFVLAFFAVVALAGCKNALRSVDPKFRKIQEMVDSQLPEGTPRARVEIFLHSRGYDSASSADGKTTTAIIRHVDEETLQPVTARVTFSFDAHEKLSSYEIAPAPMNP